MGIIRSFQLHAGHQLEHAPANVADVVGPLGEQFVAQRRQAIRMNLRGRFPSEAGALAFGNDLVKDRLDDRIVAAVRCAFKAQSALRGILADDLRVGPTNGFGVGNDNELSSDGTWTYYYNAAGDVTSRTDPASGMTWTYSYDDANEQTGAVDYLFLDPPADLTQKDASNDFEVSLSASKADFMLKFKGLLNSMAEGLLVLDETGRIELANRALANLFGVTAELRSKTILEALRVHELADLVDFLGTEKRVLGYELKLSPPNERWLQVNGAAIFNGGGQRD